MKSLFFSFSFIIILSSCSNPVVYEYTLYTGEKVETVHTQAATVWFVLETEGIMRDKAEWLLVKDAETQRYLYMMSRGAENPNEYKLNGKIYRRAKINK